MTRFFWLVALLGACSPSDAVVVVDVALDAGTLPGTEGEPALAGVTIDADGGRVVLDAWGGLFRIDEGGAEVLATPQALVAPGIGDGRPYTDVVALEPGAFAVTVRGDGLRFDEASGLTQQHFCYEPGFMEEQTVSEITEAVAFDAARGLIYAQPRTDQGGESIASSIGVYDVLGGGQPLEWHDLGMADFLAGGMVVDGDDLLMARGTQLYRGSPDDPRHTYLHLGDFVNGDIQGLAIDPAADRLVLVTRDQWVELENWR